LPDGIVVIDKPAGMTSFDVVARVRRLAGTRRVGHAGTLDPAATGILPVCIGQATRLVEYLGESGKAYRATVRLGIETTTYDAEGDVVATREVPPDLDAARIQSALGPFAGEIEQVPPRYSALKRDGRRMYDLARNGVDFTPAPRRVRIDNITLVSWQPPVLMLDVACGKGTYIRSLAHDIGERLSTGGHLSALDRTRVGHFTRRDSVTLDALAEAVATGAWRDHLYAPDEAVLDLHAAILGPESARRLGHGLTLSWRDRQEDTPDLLRAYSTDGRFLGLLRRRAPGDWHPEKVFAMLPVE
jgi:tRNA pseudouridine55 synthase